jgi:hypothetical protein
MAQPNTAWDHHPEPLTVTSAPAPEYGSGSLADLLPRWPQAWACRA